MDSLFILLQYLLPQHWLSRITGWLAECRTPWLKNVLIRLFARHFRVDMGEAAEPVLEAYPNFNAFFTRALVGGARPIVDSAAAVACPADGVISQLGAIEHGRLLQAKGRHFTVADLLADEAQAHRFENGRFATIYLAPGDYHRVHMPTAGELTAQTYVPGKLYSVNRVTTENITRLFAQNERLACHFDTEYGPMAMVLVGAMIVAGIETVWSGQVAPPTREPKTVDYQRAPAGVKLARGEEMGRFKLGSTVILLFPGNTVEWDARFREGTATRMGELLATVKSG